MFNIRGSDISFNPVPVSAALLTQDNAFLFIDNNKLGDVVKKVPIVNKSKSPLSLLRLKDRVR